MPKHRPNIQELSRIFFEFSYFDAMNGVPFKPRAYQLASESMLALGSEVEETWKKGGIKELKKLPGIGQALSEKIDEYFRTGRVKEYEAIKKRFPVDIWGLAQIEGLGARHIGELYKHLRVRNVEDLKKALAKKKLSKLPRWGEKSEMKIAKALQLMESSTGRHLLGDILPIADHIVKELSAIRGVKRCAYAGSLRRRQETVGDIDLLVTSNDPERVMEAFAKLPLVQTVHERGKTRSSVRLTIGIDADLRVVPDKVFGAALQYFTGDKRHNVLLREHALSKGFTLNEYGLFRTKRKGVDHGKGSLVVCKTEEEIYTKLGMRTPPPELRIGGDELAAAQKNTLPDLLPYGSVRGDLQVQTDWTDGSSSIEEMALAAKKAGLSYMAVTDHTKALAFIHGLDDKRIREQGKEIDRLNKKLHGFRVLKGTECDILKDGSLDLSDTSLAALDWVGISVHSHFHLSREEQTARIVKAMSHPMVDCLFHPTARRIGKRDPIDLDMDAVIAAAKKYHVILEIDASPERSDLRDLHVRSAIKAGVMLVIDSDAHAPDQFSVLPLGEAIARRGWAEKRHILNTKTLKEMQVYLAKKKRKK
jgi:DNA polymerase (family 10)